MTSVEEQLRETFRRRADDAGKPIGVYDAVLVRHRRSRRHRVIGAAAVACALVLVAVPVTQSMLDAEPTGGGIASPSAAYPLPPRGSLAGDEEFLAGVLLVPWAGDDAMNPPVNTRQVVYAGEVAGARWARLVAQVDGELVGEWFSGPAGAPGDTLASLGRTHPLPTGPLVFRNFIDGTGVLIVIAEPGDSVSISERAHIDAAGTVSRDYQPVDTVDGVAAVDLAGDLLPALSVRVDRGSETVYRGGDNDGFVAIGPDDQPATWTNEQIAAAATGALGTAAPNPEVARRVLEHLTAGTGYAVDELDLSVLWADTVGPPAEGKAHAVLISAVLPSGAVAILGGYGAFDAGGLLALSVVDLLTLHPSGTSPEDLLLVMQSDFSDGTLETPVSGELVVVGPVGSASFRVDVPGPTVVVPADGRTLSLALVDVIGVQALDGEGNVIAEEPVAGVADVADRGDGPVN